MKKVSIEDYKSAKEIIPSDIGVFILHLGDDVLLCKCTENLHRFICFYLNTKTSPLMSLGESIITAITHISYKQCDRLIEAFIEEILLNTYYKPLYDNNLNVWKDYLYLGFNFLQPPYIKISDQTIENYYYLGPFRNRFTLVDVLDIFTEIFKLPLCENENYPCERLNENLCLGFCQNKLKEALPEMINRLMLLPNKEAISKLNETLEAYKNDLEFLKADKLHEQILMLKKYYKNVLFAYTSNDINGDFKVNDYTLIINNGLICEIIGRDTYINLDKKTDLSYRKTNELLAYPKDEYDHRWIVFSFLYKTEPDYIEELFLDSLQTKQKTIFNGG